MKAIALLAAGVLLGGLVGCTSTAYQGGKTDIIETAQQAESFKTLLSALEATELTQTLKEKGPFTVFAPNDDAFNRLPAGTLDELLKPENKEKLRAILTYHVVAGTVSAQELKKIKSTPTINGQHLAITAEGETVMVDKVKIVRMGIRSKNGRIHVIDSVLMPK